MRVASYALGCKVNQYESEAIAELFAKAGYEIVSVEDTADIYIINTCTVTNFGDKKSRQLIRRVKRQNPDAVVAVVGCYAQTAEEEMKQMEEVNLVLGTQGRDKLVFRVEEYLQKKNAGVVSYVGPVLQEAVFEPLSLEKIAGRTRAYLKIQDGCSQFCSYCIIPYARGPVRSRPYTEIMEEVRTLSENGFQEVILTGIHVASYGREMEKFCLLDVIRGVSEIEGIRRIRMSSVEPNLITEEFAEAVSKIKKVCHHFHLSLQSGCDKTLLAMNRKYTTKQYQEAAERLRRRMPEVALTTDMIVGFPGETEADFQASMQFAKEMQFAKIHVFPYSPKRGTPAAKRPDQIQNDEKARRAKELGAVSDEMGQSFRKQYLGQDIEVLFERETAPGVYEGHTGNYILVSGTCEANAVNQIKMVRIDALGQDGLSGRIL